MKLWQELNGLRSTEKVLGQLPVGTQLVQLRVSEMTASMASHGHAMGICAG